MEPTTTLVSQVARYRLDRFASGNMRMVMTLKGACLDFTIFLLFHKDLKH